MPEPRSDQALRRSLDWAIQRMKESGYPVQSRVQIVVDPGLEFMGYAREEKGVHYIVASEWALDSEMLGGFLIHELSHIYSTEKGTPSHDQKILESVLSTYREKEDLTRKELAYLMDCFSHFQNIIVDDIVFDVMSEREKKQAQKFFASSMTPRPTGNPFVDASSLVRNAFALASLKRRNLFAGMEEMEEVNSQFLSFLGEKARDKQHEVEQTFELCRADTSDAKFRAELERFFDLVLSIARERSQFEDLR